MRHDAKPLSAMALAGVLCIACERTPAFVTDAGIGPDKWASVWLIRRHVDRSAEVIVADDRAVAGAVPFDTDEAELRRTAASTTYEKLLTRYGIEDETALRVGRIVRDMEINSWGEKALAHSTVVESQYRRLQRRHGRESIPQGCYLSFFDTLSRSIERSPTPSELERTLSTMSCDAATTLDTPGDVAELPLVEILRQLGSDRSVVFLDTRERIEFEEYHIPGAVRRPLREIDDELADTLRAADLVVPYCVKDFRGYEAARRLQALGVHQVAIMNPYGIKGWRRAGLPVVLPDGPDEKEMLERLMSCAERPEGCLAEHARSSTS